MSKSKLMQEIRRLLPLLALAGILLAQAGCSRPAPHVLKVPAVISAQRYQVGLASWYGPGFHGRRTSSGEIFNMYELTAAHLTLPLGTSVMVTRPDNGRSVNVRVNDRGPFVEGRIVDLSYAAARVLNMEQDGLAQVRLEVLDQPLVTTHLPQHYTVQVGSFIYYRNATNLKSELERKFNNVFIDPYSTPSDRYYRVRVGTFRSREEAMGAAQSLAAEGHCVYILPLD